MKKDLNILITNDDGIRAPGLAALARELRTLGEVHVLAPDRNWSASGHVRTLDRPLRASADHMCDGTPAFSCDGAPSDCVALGISGFFKKTIDLVVTGINTSANLGHDVTYSGTVTSAMEAAIWGIPSVAVSLDRPVGAPEERDYTPAARAAVRVSQLVLRHGLPPNTLLSVNVPNLPEDQLRGFEITRQGLRVYHDRLVVREDPRGRPYYWVIGDQPTSISEPGSDAGALEQGFISVTPLQLDMTAAWLAARLESWDWNSRFESIPAEALRLHPAVI